MIKEMTNDARFEFSGWSFGREGTYGGWGNFQVRKLLPNL